MPLTFDQLKDAAADLPNAERAVLARFLLDSLAEGNQEAAIQAEWLALAERRLAELESGQVQAIPAVQVLQNLLGRKS